MKYISYTLLGIFISLLLSCANGPTTSKVNHQVKFKPFTLNAKFYDVDGSPINGLILKLYAGKIVEWDTKTGTGGIVKKHYGNDKSGTTDQKGFVSLKGMNYRDVQKRFTEFNIGIINNSRTKNFETGRLMNLRDIISNKIENKDDLLIISHNESFDNSVHIINLDFRLGLRPKYFYGAFDMFPKKLIDEIDNLSDFDDNKSVRFILNNVDIPYGTVRGKKGDKAPDEMDYTQWVVIKDLTHNILYFRDYENLTLRKIKMNQLKFKPGSPAFKQALVDRKTH